jgi:hypothetical protein
MSAFVVSIECMERAVRAICTRDVHGQIVPSFDGIMTDGSMMPDDTSAPTEIGRRLFALNIEAVQQRYPDTIENSDDLPGPCDDEGKSTALADAAAFKVAQFKYEPREPSLDVLVDGFKAMQCVHYQCAEGDIPEKSALYAELARAIGKVAERIVSRLPAYDAAQWG